MFQFVKCTMLFYFFFHLYIPSHRYTPLWWGPNPQHDLWHWLFHRDGFYLGSVNSWLVVVLLYNAISLLIVFSSLHIVLSLSLPLPCDGDLNSILGLLTVIFTIRGDQHMLRGSLLLWGDQVAGYFWWVFMMLCKHQVHSSYSHFVWATFPFA